MEMEKQDHHTSLMIKMITLGTMMERDTLDGIQIIRRNSELLMIQVIMTLYLEQLQIN